MISPITLKEMAKISGFSISTVSKALNNGIDISESTKVKIKELAELCNYIPNRQAKALRNKKTNIIAVVFPKFCLKKYANILEGFEEEAQYRGYRIIIWQLDKKETNNVSKLLNPINGYIDGLVVLVDNKKVYRDENQFGIINQSGFVSIKQYVNFTKLRNNYENRRLGNIACTNLVNEIFKQRECLI